MVSLATLEEMVRLEMRVLMETLVIQVHPDPKDIRDLKVKVVELERLVQLV